MRLALYQPDQAGNVGAILRLAACLGVPVDIAELCDVPWGDKALTRAGVDYAKIANVSAGLYRRHRSDVENEMSDEKFFNYIRKSVRNSFILLILFGAGFIVYYVAVDRNPDFIQGGVAIIIGSIVLFGVARLVINIVAGSRS
jgi:hypothetical protein